MVGRMACISYLESAFYQDVPSVRYPDCAMVSSRSVLHASIEVFISSRGLNSPATLADMQRECAAYRSALD